MTRACLLAAMALCLAPGPWGATAWAQDAAIDGPEAEDDAETEGDDEAEPEAGDDAEPGAGDEAEPPPPTDDASGADPMAEGAVDLAPVAGRDQVSGDSLPEPNRRHDDHPEALDVCRTDLRGRPIGPLQVGELDGFLGVPHRACPRREMSIGADALLVADTANFYGNIRVNGRGRVTAPLLDPRVEGFVAWEAFRWQTVISSVDSEYIGLGYLSWGARGQVYYEGGTAVSVVGRMVLPTTTGLDNSSQPLAMDLGVAAAFRVDPAVRFHVWGLLLGSVRIGGPAAPRGGLRVGGGVDLRAAEWISFVIEVASGFLYSSDDVDLLAANLGVRLGFSDEVGLELAAGMPFVGPRSLESGALPLVASLMLNWHQR